MPKRSYGTGSLAVRRGARGRESWYGQWRVGGRRVTRKLDVKREAETRTGLTRAQAERRLQRLIDAETSAPVQTRVGAGESSELPEDDAFALAVCRALGWAPPADGRLEAAA